MYLVGKKVLVVGLGRSGVAAARLCVEKGAIVLGTDQRPERNLSPAARELGIKLHAGEHRRADFLEADLVVVSPGVPPLELLDEAEQAGVTVIGELELAADFLSAPVLAVGGTNGKSTTATLLTELLRGADMNVFAGGNLGTPLSEAVGHPHDALVVEVSSFQLERAPTFHPRVSVLLNISEDHLDRYPGFNEYARAKGNAMQRLEEGDTAVIPAGDTLCAEQARRGRGRLVTFGRPGDQQPHADYLVVDSGVLEVRTGERFELGDTELVGGHNALNAAAAIAAARAFRLPSRAVRRGLTAFRSLPHRMTLVGVVEGVAFYDDSKATNVGAAVTAVRGVKEHRVVLIAGGRDKLAPYTPLAEALSERGRAVVALGEAAERIAEACSGVVPVERVANMEAAVAAAQRLAEPGDAVLLSPACSSFDMFDNYAARGRAFVQAVQHLAQQGAQ